MSHWKDMPLLLRCCLSSTVVFTTGRTWGSALSERCLSCLSSVCEAAQLTISELLSCSSSAQCKRLVLQLGERLQCLRAALSWRSAAAAAPQRPACMAAVAAALAQLWHRFPRNSEGSGGGRGWLLARLAAVSAHLTDLFTDRDVITVLEVCGRGVESEAGRPGRGGVREAVVAVWGSLAHRSIAPSSLPSVTHTLAGVCCMLVSEEQNPWLCQMAFSSFVQFAQRTPHKQIVSAIVQSCSADVRTRLQQFVLGKPHPSPLGGLTRGTEGCADETTIPHGPPLFLFYQQCLITSKTSAALKRNHPSPPSRYSCEEVKLGDDSRPQKLGEQSRMSCTTDMEDTSKENDNHDLHNTILNKRPFPNQDSTIQDILKNLSSCQNLMEANRDVAVEDLQETLRCSERLLWLLKAAFAGPAKRIKPDSGHS